MYDDLADKLIAEVRRAETLQSLPIYNTDFVRAINQMTRTLGQLREQALETAETREDMLLPAVYERYIQRNKRCLLAYHHHRANRIANLVLHDQEPEDVNNLSPHEQEYMRNYSDLLIQFKENWEDIDLTGSMDPPREVYVEIRCLKDAGEIQTEYGVFDLTKNSQFYVRQSDVQRLIQQGLVELVQK